MSNNKLWDQLPDRCFISHSYYDVDSMKLFKNLLPKELKEVIFDRVEPDPSKAVSDRIIPSILNCSALVYFKRGASASSFWVSFERDYALRSGLTVYAFDPIDQTLTVDNSSPLALDVIPFYHQNDAGLVSELFKWMRTKRNFNLEPFLARSQFGGVKGRHQAFMEQLLISGGVVLWFASQDSTAPISMFRGPSMGGHIIPNEDFRREFINEHLSSSTEDGLEDVDDISDQNYNFYAEVDPYQHVSEVHVRIDPGLNPAWQPPGAQAIDLVVGAENNNTFNWIYVDDLIIRLYAAILEHKRRLRISPPMTRAILLKHVDPLVNLWEYVDKSYGRVRIGLDDPSPNCGLDDPSPNWWLSILEAQFVWNKVFYKLYDRFGEKEDVSPLTHPNLPFEKDFPADYAVIWERPSSILELSMDLEGPFANVFLRRYPHPHSDT